jgi:hypothetical protein
VFAGILRAGSFALLPLLVACGAAEPQRAPLASAKPPPAVSAHPSVTAAAPVASAPIAPSASTAPLNPNELTLPSAWPCPPPEGEIQKAADSEGATSFVAYDGELYWSNGRSIWRQRVGEKPTMLLRTVTPFPLSELYAQGDDLFILAKQSYSTTCTGNVHVVPRKGGKVETLLSGKCPASIAANASHIAIVVRTAHPEGGGWESGNLYLVERGSGKPAVKVGEDAVGTDSGVAMLQDRVFIEPSAGQVHSVLLERPNRFDGVANSSLLRFAFGYQDLRLLATNGSDTVFYYGSGSADGGPRLFKVDAKGGEPQALASFSDIERARPPGMNLAVSEKYAYLTHPNSGYVLRAALSGKCGGEFFAKERGNPDWVQVMDGWVYWLDKDRGTVWRRKE